MEQTLTRLQRLAVERLVATGARLFEEGETPNGAYFLLSGRIRLLVRTSSGKMVVTRAVRPGELFGVAPLFSGKPYEGYAEALETSRIGFIPKRALFDLIERTPEIRLPILRIVSEDVSGCQHFLRFAGSAA